jgi:hypothetical protein
MATRSYSVLTIILSALAIPTLQACGPNVADTCAAYRWGVVNGATELGAAISEEVNSECLVCPDDIAAGEVSVSESVRRGALVACLDTDVDAARCDAVAEGVADSISAASIDDAVASCPEINDADADGVVAASDCDDADATVLAQSGDRDCDGVLTDADCDDTDANSTSIAEDADCDDTVTSDDCDDADASSLTEAVDGDCDGIVTEDDCDDADPALLAQVDDVDCDGTLTAADCDDSDPLSTAIADDRDCDGTPTADDCDDTDADSTIVADDGDCDTVLAWSDCDDADPTSTAIADDHDCDGTVMVDDCDDESADSTIVADDHDCDGTLLPADCDNDSASLGDRAEDADCDGVLTDLDCGDNDTTLGAIAEDADCDRTLTLFDCDDADASSTVIADDADCDTVLTALDCSDVDASSTVKAEDADCDTVLTAADCDDTDPALLAVSGDADCDGAVTLADCDDDDATSTTLATDADCDTVLTAADCDDTDATSTTVATDADCDAYVTAADCDDTDPYSTVVATDADCDGTMTSRDCDDADATSTTRATDADCDTVLTAADCDDTDATLLAIANDRDCDGSVRADDCDDADPAVNPSAVEICDDGIDNNCDSSAGACELTSTGLSSALEWTGEAGYNYTGNSVGGGGDVNGDGYDDILVGAKYSDDGATSSGAAYLVLGSAAPASASLSTKVEYTGEAASDYAGSAVAVVGDVNADGYDDMMVGAYLNNDGATDAGAAYLVLGSASPASASLSAKIEYKGEAASDYAGQAVSTAGDVNGDGYADMLIGALYNDDGATDAGAAYLVLGSASPSSASLSTKIEYKGETAGDWAGYAVAGGGDVDGDGFDDLLIGAPEYNSQRGGAYLIYGSAGPASTSLSAAAQRFYGGTSVYGGTSDYYTGFAVAMAGDTNGDGYTDMLVGAPYNSDNDTYAGSAYLILGSASGGSGALSSAYDYDGETYQDLAGSAVSGAGDVDADGYDDFLVGAYRDNNGALLTGTTYLVFGAARPAPTDLSDTVEFTGEGSGDLSGWAVGPAGDVDADGFADFLIGAPGNETAYLIFGTGL